MLWLAVSIGVLGAAGAWFLWRAHRARAIQETLEEWIEASTEELMEAAREFLESTAEDWIDPTGEFPVIVETPVR